MEGREKEVSNLHIRDMGGEPIKPDADGGAAQGVVEGDKGGIGPLCNKGESVGEGGKEEEFWVRQPRLEDQA